MWCFYKQTKNTFTCVVSCATSFPKGFETLDDYNFFLYYPLTNKKKKKLEQKVKNKTQRERKWYRILRGQSLYIEKQKCKCDDHIWVSKWTLSFFVENVKRKSWLVIRHTLLSRSNHHYFAETWFFLVPRWGPEYIPFTVKTPEWCLVLSKYSLNIS